MRAGWLEFRRDPQGFKRALDGPQIADRFEPVAAADVIERCYPRRAGARVAEADGLTAVWDDLAHCHAPLKISAATMTPIQNRPQTPTTITIQNPLSLMIASVAPRRAR